MSSDRNPNLMNLIYYLHSFPLRITWTWVLKPHKLLSLGKVPFRPTWAVLSYNLVNTQNTKEFFTLSSIWQILPYNRTKQACKFVAFTKKFYNSLVMFCKFKTLKSIIYCNLLNTQNIKKSFSLLVKVLYCKSFITKPTSYKNANA